VAHFLIDHGAKANIVDAQGKGPLDILKGDVNGRDHKADAEIMSLLQSSVAGAPAARTPPAGG
jgi:hypothetical protein